MRHPTTFANAAKQGENKVNHAKLQEYSKIAAGITAAMDTLLQVQSLFVDLLLKECDIPVQMKDDMIKDMNKRIGEIKI